ncbi:MAG: HRDC domain-containing protein [Chloroflexota bacterium]
MRNPILVDNQPCFDQMMVHLRDQRIIALDTESDSLFRYYPKVCLIQLSAYALNQDALAQVDPANIRDYITDYLVDPLKLPNIAENMSALGMLMADPDIEVIIHSAENDIYTLQKDFHFTFKNIFDTQLAARILGWKRVGLAAMLQNHFGVESDKSMQLADWGERPLTHKHISYAGMDTHYLLPLRDLLIQALRRERCWAEMQDACDMLETLDYHTRPVNERSVWQMKQVGRVPLARMGFVESLWLWREETAQQLDMPPFKIMRDNIILSIVERNPNNMIQLKRIKGIQREHKTLLADHGATLLKAIRQGRTRTPPKLPLAKSSNMPDPPTQRRFDMLRKWRTQRAKSRGVDPEIVFSNAILMRIAHRIPQSIAELQTISGVSEWKANHYGDEILIVLAR